MKNISLFAMLSILTFGGIALGTSTPAYAQPVTTQAQVSTIQSMELDAEALPQLSLNTTQLGNSDLFQMILVNTGTVTAHNLSIRLDNGIERFIPRLESGHTYVWTAPVNITNNATVRVYEAGIANPLIIQPLLSNG